MVYFKFLAHVNNYFYLEHEGSSQHDQAYAFEESYCLPQERHQEEGMCPFPSLQRWCWPMQPGKYIPHVN